MVAFSSDVVHALDALDRLREGNRRFAASVTTTSASSAARRVALVAGQEPFAIILGCSDSRVPAELVFDQGFGDLFVIRVAGNVVAPSQVGSVEFAASRYGTRLVVVMGHTQCGAIIATLEELQGTATSQSRNLRSIVDRVRPSIETLIAGRPGRGSGRSPARGGPCERARIGGPSAAWLRAARITDQRNRPPHRRCGVFAGDWDRGFLRHLSEPNQDGSRLRSVTAFALRLRRGMPGRRVNVLWSGSPLRHTLVEEQPGIHGRGRADAGHRRRRQRRHFQLRGRDSPEAASLRTARAHRSRAGKAAAGRAQRDLDAELPRLAEGQHGLRFHVRPDRRECHDDRRDGADSAARRPGVGGLLQGLRHHAGPRPGISSRRGSARQAPGRDHQSHALGEPVRI